jgi:hypothetical protein
MSIKSGPRDILLAPFGEVPAAFIEAGRFPLSAAILGDGVCATLDEVGLSGLSGLRLPPKPGKGMPFPGIGGRAGAGSCLPSIGVIQHPGPLNRNKITQKFHVLGHRNAQVSSAK